MMCIGNACQWAALWIKDGFPGVAVCVEVTVSESGKGGGIIAANAKKIMVLRDKREKDPLVL
jgi:hypothetical protein